MLTPAKQTIYAAIDALIEETGEAIYLSVHRSFEHGMRALPTLLFVAEVRNGNPHGRSTPVFVEDGEQALRAVAQTEEEALSKLAAMCCLVPA
jgi:hypothetical protein